METVPDAREGNFCSVILRAKGGHDRNQRWPGAELWFSSPPGFPPQPLEGSWDENQVRVPCIEGLSLLQGASHLVRSSVFFHSVKKNFFPPHSQYKPLAFFPLE